LWDDFEISFLNIRFNLKEIIQKRSGMNEFELKAEGWDANPMHLERSRAIADKIKEIIPLRKAMHALEFGAGTGLLSLLLRDEFDSVTMIDSSREMIGVIDQKLHKQDITNMKTRVMDLEKEDLHDRFDIILTQMVLHHVIDINGLLDKFYQVLNPGGYIAIADLYKEDGSFHDEPFHGHHGFDTDALTELVSQNRFVEIRHQPCFVIQKKSETNESRAYPVFLLTARKA
jgi:tRNA (cmo5U34)-methyltransferase